MDDSMHNRPSAEQFYKIVPWAQGLGFIAAGLAILYVSVPVQTVTTLGFLGNIFIAILPQLVISAAICFLALRFFTWVMRSILLYLQDALDDYLAR